MLTFPDPATQEEVSRRLARAGQRWTGGRRDVVAAFARATAPLSVQEVHDLVGPAVPLSSLYRILADLVAAGILIRLEFAEGFARYELDEGLAEHHHHLVCTGCGIVADLELPDLERTIGETARSIRQRAGFEARTHRLDFFGLCGACEGQRVAEG
ncbi:MAG: Fur family transcriptional regulator, ferric uptake regulator [Actinomycetota bacterium]|nr:Fur family transcriptional regulator, ferric uptake regulator [Actinomycetota bacterium]MEA2843962.1 Fur family transcriptional regulator, ferric uptake regulator [Actinomycetota bacterium]